METERLEAPGMPPADLMNPHLTAGFRADGPEAPPTSPALQIKFYTDADPRTDAFDNTVLGPDGSVPMIELVDVININDPKNILTQVVTDVHRQKLYPREYAAFKQGLDMRQSGFALRDWKGDNARVRNLEHWNIHTVEQMAAASDGICMSIGPGTMDLRNAAIAFLKVRADSGVAEKAMAENAALKRQIAEQGSQMANLTRMVESMMATRGASEPVEQHPAEIDPLAPPKNKGGRPRIHPRPEEN